RQSSVTPSRSRSEYRRMYSSMNVSTGSGTIVTLARVAGAVNATARAGRADHSAGPSRGALALQLHTRYTYPVCRTEPNEHERPARPPRPPERGAQVRSATAER